MRVGLALAIVVALTAGCADAPAAHVSREPVATASGSPAPLPPLRLSYGDLVDALPLASEVYPWKVTVRCLTVKAKCGHYLEGRGAVLFGHGATSQEVDEQLMVGAIRWPTTEDAEEAVGKLRGGYEDEIGRFHTKAHRTSPTSYTLGTTGHGDLAALDLDGWAGWKFAARYRLSHLDKRTTKTSDMVEMVLTRDRYTVHVRVSRWLPTNSGDRSRQIAEEQLTQLIAALETRG